MTVRGLVGPPAKRPFPLINVASGVGMKPASGAGTWYLMICKLIVTFANF